MSIRKPAAPISTLSSCEQEPSTCEACGNSFACGATLGGCWCTEVMLSERLRTQLRARYQHCLCRDCLERFAAAEEKETSAKDALPIV
jgi:Cysteine-rich CWC